MPFVVLAAEKIYLAAVSSWTDMSVGKSRVQQRKSQIDVAKVQQICGIVDNYK